MKAYRFSLFCLFLLCTITTFSQDLGLAFRDRTKFIKAGNFIEVEMPRPDERRCKKCVTPTVTGEFISYDGEYLKMQVMESYEKIIIDGNEAGYNFKSYSKSGNGPVVDIPYPDILSVKRKGRNHFQRKNPAQVVGDVLSVLTLVIIPNTSYGEIGYSKVPNIMTVGLITTTLATVAFRQPRFVTNPESNYFKKKNKIWNLATVNSANHLP